MNCGGHHHCLNSQVLVDDTRQRGNGVTGACDLMDLLFYLQFVTEWNFISYMTILVIHMANEAQRAWGYAHGKLELALILAFILFVYSSLQHAPYWKSLSYKCLADFPGCAEHGCLSWSSESSQGQPSLQWTRAAGTLQATLSFPSVKVSAPAGRGHCSASQQRESKRERAQRRQGGGEKWLEAPASHFLYKIRGEYKAQLNIAACLQHTVSTSTIRVQNSFQYFE